jgi:hypothetical protein
MNAVPRSVLPQRRRSRRPAANSRVMRSRAASSSNVTSMPSRTSGQMGEKLKSSDRNSSPPSSSNAVRFERSAVRHPHIHTKASAQTLSLSQRPTPIWLSPLLFLQRGSDIVTFVLVAATLTLYAWTVYTQQQWTQEYRKLENLQRDERHLTTTNALIKDQLAQQAEKPATGLVTPTPANTIFLPPAPQRPSSSTPSKTAASEPTGTVPLGY